MIRKKGFLFLEIGDKIRLHDKRILLVCGNFPTNGCDNDVPPPREIILEYPDGNVVEFGWGPHGIMDDNWGHDVDLNHRDTHIIPKNL